MFTEQQKQLLKKQLIDSLKTESEVCRIVIFGSFLSSKEPHDMDVAVRFVGSLDLEYDNRMTGFN